MILPTGPLGRYPKLPQISAKKKILHKLLVKRPGYLPVLKTVAFGKTMQLYATPRIIWKKITTKLQISEGPKKSQSYYFDSPTYWNYLRHMLPVTKALHSREVTPIDFFGLA